MTCKYKNNITKLYSYKNKNKWMITCKYENCNNTNIGIIILLYVFEYM